MISTNPETIAPTPEKPVEVPAAPATEASEEKPKELTKSQLKKLAKQKNAKPKMSKEEKMKAVHIIVYLLIMVVGFKGKCCRWR